MSLMISTGVEFSISIQDLRFFQLSHKFCFTGLSLGPAAPTVQPELHEAVLQLAADLEAVPRPHPLPRLDCGVGTHEGRLTKYFSGVSCVHSEQ